MGYKSITQIALFIISLVVIFTYIKPTFIAMKSTQDEIFQYSDASDKATQLNAQLAQLLSAEKSFAREDLMALETYLPNTIDDMAVMADITAMAGRSNLKIVMLSSGELILPEEDVLFEGKRIVSDGTSHVDFTVEVSGTYDSLKQMLRLIEQNKYPLEIIDLTIGEFIEDEERDVTSSLETLEGQYKFVVRTYAYSRIRNNSSL
jgi:hypothetical protein